MLFFSKAKKLQTLADEAARLADEVAAKATEQWLVSDATNAADQFRRISKEVREDVLPLSGGAGLGITKALGEWAPKKLYKAGKALEDYYREKWR